MFKENVFPVTEQISGGIIETTLPDHIHEVFWRLPSRAISGVLQNASKFVI
jgi:hypothetical protein